MRIGIADLAQKQAKRDEQVPIFAATVQPRPGQGGHGQHQQRQLPQCQRATDSRSAAGNSLSGTGGGVRRISSSSAAMTRVMYSGAASAHQPPV